MRFLPRGGLAVLCAASVVAFAGQASAAVVYLESGTLRVFCGPVPCPPIDTFQIGANGGSRSLSDAQPSGAYHYELTLSDPSVILSIQSRITDYSSWDRFVDGALDLGNDVFAIETPDPSLHATPTGFAGDFIVPPTYDETTLSADGLHLLRFREFYFHGIYIDGLLTAPTGYTFVINSVPEPATWMVMLVGFFGIGAALRTRRGVARTVSP